jgi:hypothetical protein
LQVVSAGEEVSSFFSDPLSISSHSVMAFGDDDPEDILVGDDGGESLSPISSLFLLLSS